MLLCEAALNLVRVVLLCNGEYTEKPGVDTHTALENVTTQLN